MTKYREILRLKSLGFSERNIALAVPCSRNTVSKVLNRAGEKGISWPLPDDTTDADLERLLSSSPASTTTKRMPDYEYISAFFEAEFLLVGNPMEIQDDGRNIKTLLIKKLSDMIYLVHCNHTPFSSLDYCLQQQFKDTEDNGMSAMDV